MDKLQFSSEFVPPPTVQEASNMARLLEDWGVSYERFLELSWEDPQRFWEDFLKRIRYPWLKTYTTICDSSRGIAWTRWFIDGECNLTYAAVDQYALSKPHSTAVIALNEAGERKAFTYRELYEKILRCSQGLLSHGINTGDCVGILLPMSIDVVVALLALARIGAIAVPLFSGFGPDAIRVRLEDSRAKALITITGFYRRGKWVPIAETVRQAVENLSHLEKIFLFGAEEKERKDREIPADDLWKHGEHSHLIAFPSDTPFMLIYTSGTTGKPKGTVHVHAGFPIKAAQDMYHLFDLKAEDRLFWLTDIGWMMGPWLILGGLTLGATIVLYDGAPDYPHPGHLFEIWDREKVTVAGVTPTWIRSLIPLGERIVEPYPLESLRLLGSTGEPWNTDPWRWTFRYIGKERTPIINYSGGTEISGGILGCVVLRPFKPTGFNTPVPGVHADAVNEEGKPVRNEVGYLVVYNPNPGMTRGFWNDPQRYEETYFQRFPGVWYHGDLVFRDEEDHFFILGRADDTIKVAGKRLGPAEMESVAVEHPAVREAAVIGIPDAEKGEVPMVFAVLRDATQKSEALARELKEWIAERMGKALRPREVLFLSDLPKTRNAKVMRRVIRRVFLGENLGDLSALVNPEIIAEIARLKERSHILSKTQK